MARQAKGKVRIVVEIEEIETDVGADSRTVTLPHRIEYNWEFLSGTTDGTQIDRVWSTDDALTTTPEDSDLQGSLASKLNGSNTVTIADLVGIVATCDDAQGGDNVQIGAGTNPVTAMLASGDVATVRPQGILVWIAPYGAAVGAAASDILRMVASANTALRRAIVFGRSA